MNEILDAISKDFANTSKLLKKVSHQMIGQGFKYPVFILSKDKFSAFPILFDKETGNNWIYHASYLDILISSNLIEKTKKEDFIKNYKDPEEYCCLMIITPKLTKIAFAPFYTSSILKLISKTDNT